MATETTEKESVMRQTTEDHVAAALTAISLYLAEEEEPFAQEKKDWRWVSTAMMVTQGIPIIRAPRRPTWGNVERLRRAGRGGTGIIGL
jgi:hypothetical protein